MKYFISDFRETNDTNIVEPRYMLIDNLVDQLPIEIRQQGVIVNVPAVDAIEGKTSKLLYNKATQQAFYAYEDIVYQKSKEEILQEKISLLEQQNASMNADFQAFMDFYFENNPV